jgi:nitroimidazol reductase NimA-like FMN-containing flavoprotein (pyridoxamine 5'-phosphate oxidase superfamily)
MPTTQLKPSSEKNLDIYGSPPLTWERALERLEQEWKVQAPPEMGGDAYPHTHWLVTTRPDGKPHVTGIGAVWDGGKFYFTSGAGTQKSRNLAKNPNCSIALAAKDIDLVVEGRAEMVTDNAKLQHVAEVFAVGGWAPEVREGAFYHEFSAPSAGPPPWAVYELTPKTVFGLATAEPWGATRWRL